MSLGPEEPNAIVALDAGKGRVTPNVRAAQIELYEGLKATSQNAWPSREWDALSLVGLLADFMPAGFYYKTFMQPRAAWAKLYEPAIRWAAGLGVAPKDPDPDHYAFEYAHCDVAVIGGGPAGLAAALAAARAGARVILFDDQAEFGGSLLAETKARIDGADASVWLAATLAELAASPRVTLLPRTQAFGLYAQNFIGARAAADRPSRRARSRHARASGCGRCAPSASCWRPARSSARWSSPTTTGRGSCSPRRRGRSRRATASSRARASSSRRRTIPAIAPRSTSPRRESRSR